MISHRQNNCTYCSATPSARVSLIISAPPTRYCGDGLGRGVPERLGTRPLGRKYTVPVLVWGWDWTSLRARKRTGIPFVSCKNRVMTFISTSSPDPLTSLCVVLCTNVRSVFTRITCPSYEESELLSETCNTRENTSPVAPHRVVIFY